MSTIKVDTTTMTSIQPNSTTRNNSSIIHHYRSFSDGFDNTIRSGGGMTGRKPPSTTTTVTTSMYGRRYHSTSLNNSSVTAALSGHDEAAATTTIQSRRDIIETQRQYRRLYNTNHNNKNKKHYNNNTSNNVFRSDYDTTNTGSQARTFPTAILSRPSNLNTNTLPADDTFHTNATVIAPILSLLNEDIDTDQSKISRIVKEVDSKWLQQYPALESRYTFATTTDDVDPIPSQVISTVDHSLCTGNGNKIDIFAAVEAICSTFDITQLCRTTRSGDNTSTITKSTIVFPSTDNWISGLLSNVIIPLGNPWETSLTLDQLSSMENAGMYHHRLSSLVNGQEEYMGELLRFR